MFGRLLCWMGLHEYSATLEEYKAYFGHLPIDHILPTARCTRCNKPYKETKDV